MNVADSEGRTPLDYAKELGQEGFQIVAILEGVDLSFTNSLVVP